MIQTEEIQYACGGATLRGLLAVNPEAKGPRPAVLVVHEWWGRGEYVEKRARMLAEAGYVGFAIDLYGEGAQAETAEQAKAMMNDAFSDLGRLKARFEAAIEAVKERPEVDASAISAIGYCFGGAVVIFMAREGLDLRAVAAFHPGSLDLGAPTKPGAVKAEVAAFVGADDPMVPTDRHEAFRSDMAAAGAKAELVVFPGVVHAFTNPGATERGERFGLPLRYDAHADEVSWKKTLELFSRAAAPRA